MCIYIYIYIYDVFFLIDFSLTVKTYSLGARIAFPHFFFSLIQVLESLSPSAAFASSGDRRMVWWCAYRWRFHTIKKIGGTWLNDEDQRNERCTRALDRDRRYNRSSVCMAITSLLHYIQSRLSLQISRHRPRRKDREDQRTEPRSHAALEGGRVSWTRRRQDWQIIEEPVTKAWNWSLIKRNWDSENHFGDYLFDSISRTLSERCTASILFSFSQL